MDVLKLSAEIIRAADSAEPILRKVDDGESRKPALAGGWSPRQVLGHLTRIRKLRGTVRF
jgi:hypothetical protein